MGVPAWSPGSGTLPVSFLLMHTPGGWGSQLQPNPVLAVVGIRGENQWMEALSLCLSNKINEYKNFKFMEK